MGQTLSKSARRQEEDWSESDVESFDEPICNFPYQLTVPKPHSSHQNMTNEVPSQTNPESTPYLTAFGRLPPQVLSNFDRAHRDIEKNLSTSGKNIHRFAHAAFDVLRGGNLSLASVNPFELDRVCSN